MFLQVSNNVRCDPDDSYLIKLLRLLFEELSQRKTKLSETTVCIHVVVNMSDSR